VREGLDNGLKIDELVGLIGVIGINVEGMFKPGGNGGDVRAGSRGAPLMVGIGIDRGPRESEIPSSRSISCRDNINV